MTLTSTIQEDVKTAMRAKDKPRLATLRLITAAIKQKEVDERIELDDAAVLAVLEKMVKQRKDSIEQFEKAKRDDLIKIEQDELAIITTYLPEQLAEDEVAKIVDDIVAATGAEGMKDMGKVMGQVKAKVAGQADMGLVSKLVKAKLF
ncbi:Transamidase GatB domain protein [hydrothermal vent metagenome]|uniref:Transamidase GatB domain protein n=1 Tax=hydrothermal vent metagenome TaxID=652676 RepID=A0A3B1A222_9ZZZZ